VFEHFGLLRKQRVRAFCFPTRKKENTFLNNRLYLFYIKILKKKGGQYSREGVKPSGKSSWGKKAREKQKTFFVSFWLNFLQSLFLQYEDTS